MKKMIAAALCILFLLCTASCGAQRAPAPDAHALYSKIVKKYDSDDYYALYDIDGNGTDELLISLSDWNERAFPDVLYAIQYGAAVKQEAYGWHDDSEWYNKFCLFKNGTIKISWSGERSGRRYLRFENGELKWQPVTYDDDESTITLPLTQEEFDQVQKELEGNGQVAEIHWKPLKESASGFGVYSDVVSDFVEKASRRNKLDECSYAFCNVGGSELLLLFTKMIEYYNGTDTNYRYYACSLRNGVAARHYIHDARVPSPPLLFENGIIKTINDSQDGGVACFYFRLEEGDLKQQVWIYKDSSPLRIYKTIPITEEEKEQYDRLQKELEGDGRQVALDWKPLAAYGR